MNVKESNNKILKAINVILFLIWPFLSMLFAIKNYRHGWTKNIVLLFSIFAGFTFVISNETMDTNRHRDKFISQAYTPHLTFNQFFTEQFSGDNKSADFFQPFLSYMISRFTDDYRVLFALFGLIMGFFYSRNLWFLLKRSEGRLKWHDILLLLAFSLVVGFWELNGFRFWTATMVYFCGTMKFLIEGQKKYLWLLLFAVLIHFSYLFPAVAFLLYLIFQNRSRAYFIFFLISLFISSLNVSYLGELLINYLPNIFHNKIQAYTDSEYVDEVNSMVSSISNYIRLTFMYVVESFLILIYFRSYNSLKNNQHVFNLFNFTLLFFGLANFISIIPSGDRFIKAAELFAISFIFLFFQRGNFDRFYLRYSKIIAPLIILFCIGALRLAFNTIGVMTLFGNLFLVKYENIEMAIIQFFN